MQGNFGPGIWTRGKIFGHLCVHTRTQRNATRVYAANKKQKSPGDRVTPAARFHLSAFIHIIIIMHARAAKAVVFYCYGSGGGRADGGRRSFGGVVVLIR